MGIITFDYDDWDDTKDKLLHRPGNVLGYTAILTSFDVGDMSSIRKRKKDKLIRETEQGVLELIAGGLEWMRKRGYSAEDIQSKVRAYKQGNRDIPDEILLSEKPVLDAVNKIANPRNRKLAESVVIG